MWLSKAQLQEMLKVGFKTASSTRKKEGVSQLRFFTRLTLLCHAMETLYPSRHWQMTKAPRESIPRFFSAKRVCELLVSGIQKHSFFFCFFFSKGGGDSPDFPLLVIYLYWVHVHSNSLSLVLDDKRVEGIFSPSWIFHSLSDTPGSEWRLEFVSHESASRLWQLG